MTSLLTRIVRGCSGLYLTAIDGTACGRAEGPHASCGLRKGIFFLEIEEDFT